MDLQRGDREVAARVFMAHPRTGKTTAPGPLSRNLQAALQCIRIALQGHPTRIVHQRDRNRRYCVGFADARGRTSGSSDCKWGHERIAGVLLTAAGAHFFSVSTRDPQVSSWLPPERFSRINEAETLGGLLFLNSFGGYLKSADVLLLIGSSAAERILIKFYGGNAWLTTIAGAFWRQAGKIDAAIWIAHVPSKANLADGPSRGDVVSPSGLAWSQLETVVPDRSTWANSEPKEKKCSTQRGRSRSLRRAQSPPRLARKHIKQMRFQGR